MHSSTWSREMAGPDFIRSFVLALLLCVAAPPVLAGVSGTRVDVEFLEAATGRNMQQVSVWISGRNLRIEQSDPARKGPKHVLVYRGDQGRFYSIDPKKSVYIEIDRALIAAMGFRTTAARREVDTQIQSLPSDQHAMLERLIGAREPGGEALVQAPVRLVATDQMAAVAGRTCRKMDLLREETLVGVVCVAPWHEIGMQQADIEVFRELANFQRELMGAQDLTPLEIVPNQDLDLLVQFDGFPMYLRKGEIGKQQSVIRVTAVESFAPTAAIFEPPSGYAQRSPLSLLAGPELPAAGAPAEPAP